MNNTTISHKRIWQIAAPMILANITTPMLGLVDTAVVGHLNQAYYLGAVAIGAMIFTFVFWGFGFLRMATTGLAAQAHGRGQILEARPILIDSARLALIIATIILLLQQPIRELALWLVSASPEVKFHATNYFDIRIWSAPATLLNYAIIGWLIGIEKTRQALVIIVIINLTNIFFDWLFVYPLDMKVDGVALATIIAEFTGLIVGCWLLRQHGFSAKEFAGIFQWRLLFSTFGHLNVHLNLMLRTLVLLLCFAFFTTQGARQGDIVLAANMVLLHFITFAAFVLDGFANAIEVLTGKTIGQRNHRALKHSFTLSAIWSALLAIFFTLIYLLFGHAIIRLLTSLNEVVLTAEHYLIWVVIAPLIAVWSYLLDGLFIGAALGKEMRNTMFISAVLGFFPAWYFLQSWGNHGLWLALLIFLLARSVTLCIYLPKVFRLAQ